MSIREHSFDTLLERRLFSLGIASASAVPGTLHLPSDSFACFIAWDARDASADEISALVEPLIRAGASYFVCWGPDCGRVHDIIDEIATNPSSDLGVSEDACIMTTWHDDEPLEEALWFFVVNSQPDEHYRESTRASLAISVDSTDWMSEIVSALEDPHGSVGRAASDDTA